MLHPSYSDLMNIVNSQTTDEKPIVTSRYSIVIATAKRARQLIEKSNNEGAGISNPLSTAVEELHKGDICISPYSKQR